MRNVSLFWGSLGSEQAWLILKIITVNDQINAQGVYQILPILTGCLLNTM